MSVSLLPPILPYYFCLTSIPATRLHLLPGRPKSCWRNASFRYLGTAASSLGKHLAFLNWWEDERDQGEAGPDDHVPEWFGNSLLQLQNHWRILTYIQFFIWLIILLWQDFCLSPKCCITELSYFVFGCTVYYFEQALRDMKNYRHYVQDRWKNKQYKHYTVVTLEVGFVSIGWDPNYYTEAHLQACERPVEFFTFFLLLYNRSPSHITNYFCFNAACQALQEKGQPEGGGEHTNLFRLSFVQNEWGGSTPPTYIHSLEHLKGIPVQTALALGSPRRCSPLPT